jgi:hypothetical protein
MSDTEQLAPNNNVKVAFKDDGLTIVMVGTLLDGREITATIGWDTQALAEANYTNAINGFRQRLGELDGQAAFANLEDNVKDSLYKLGKLAGRDVVLFTSVGGEPWKYPKGRLAATKHNSIELGAGWLYGCFYLGLHRKEVLTPEQEAARLPIENRQLKRGAALAGVALLGSIALAVISKR